MLDISIRCLVHGLNKVHVMALNVTPLLSTKLPYEGGCSGWCGLFALLILIQMQSREYCAKREKLAWKKQWCDNKCARLCTCCSDFVRLLEAGVN